jgi:hypothetical protein
MYYELYNGNGLICSSNKNSKDVNLRIELCLDEGINSRFNDDTVKVEYYVNDGMNWYTRGFFIRNTDFISLYIKMVEWGKVAIKNNIKEVVTKNMQLSCPCWVFNLDKFGNCELADFYELEFLFYSYYIGEHKMGVTHAVGIRNIELTSNDGIFLQSIFLDGISTLKDIMVNLTPEGINKFKKIKIAEENKKNKMESLFR